MLTLDEKARIFDQLWEHLLIGVAIVSRDGKFEYVNKALTQITEYTEVELLQKSWQDITHPEDLAADSQLVLETLAHDRDSYDMRKRYITKTGRIKWVLLRVKRVELPNGQFEYFLSQISELDVIALANLPIPPKPASEYKPVWKITQQHWTVIGTVLTALLTVIGSVMVALINRGS